MFCVFLVHNCINKIVTFICKYIFFFILCLIKLKNHHDSLFFWTHIGWEKNLLNDVPVVILSMWRAVMFDNKKDRIHCTWVPIQDSVARYWLYNNLFGTYKYWRFSNVVDRTRWCFFRSLFALLHISCS